MKKIILFACFSALLLACSKEEQIAEPFVAGQKVRFTVKAPESDSKVFSEYNINGVISFKWDNDDKVVVRVYNGSSQVGQDATFKIDPSTISSDKKTATFFGEMPAGGTQFDVQFPSTTPDLSNQTYSSEEALPKNKMLLMATNCQITAGQPLSFQLQPQYSALRLNLWGDKVYSNKIKVTAIDVTISDTKYTLTCGDGVDIEAYANPIKSTPFRIVVPETETSTEFKVIVHVAYTGSPIEYPQTGSGNYAVPVTIREFSSSQKFEKGKVVNMAVQRLRTEIWAPENLGTSTTDTYGLYYQYGRYVGFSYDVTEKTEAASGHWNNSDKIFTNPDANKFYTAGDSPYDWYSAPTSTKQLETWPYTNTDPVGGLGADQYIAGIIEDPCPNGWHLPSAYELNRLIGFIQKVDNTNKITNIGNPVDNGYWLNGTKTPNIQSGESYEGVFFPLAGQITVKGGSQSKDKIGFYWSINRASSAKGYGRKSWVLSIDANSQTIRMNGGINTDNTEGGASRANGLSVRCVYGNSPAVS